MSLRVRVLLAGAIVIAIASQVRADFDPFEASHNAVRNYGLEGRIEMATMLCAADLVHAGGLPSDYIASIVDPKARSTVENICTLMYEGKRVAALSIAYALLTTPAVQAVVGLKNALETIVELQGMNDPEAL